MNQQSRIKWVPANKIPPVSEDSNATIDDVFSDDCLVCTQLKHIDIAYYRHNEHQWYGIDGYQIHHVIAWCQLPKPYDEEHADDDNCTAHWIFNKQGDCFCSSCKIRPAPIIPTHIVHTAGKR